MEEPDVFGVEKTVLSETIRAESGSSAAMETRIVCTGALCTNTTCTCAVAAE